MRKEMLIGESVNALTLKMNGQREIGRTARIVDITIPRMMLRLMPMLVDTKSLGFGD